LKALDKLKDDFLANTSHELRTPLIGIIGIAETLIDGIAGELSQKTKENLSMIVYSGKRLSNLVNDIIDFSKLKNKNIELQLNAIDIKSLADVTLALSKPLLSGKPVELINNISKEIPPVEADENRLQQILVNLIGNSIKFTSKGNITIDADVIYYNENELNPGAPKGAKFVQITISDTGIGIPADKFETIFQSFEQADTSVSREYGGSGLGLSITKQLIELHRGEIKVESEVGKGSKFTFTLPVSNQNISETSKDKISQNVIMGQRFSQASYAFTRNQSNDEKEIKESQGILKNGREKQIAADSFENVNVLIVDDEPVNLHVLSNILMIEKCNITKAADGMEALEIVHNPKFKPDIILLDVMMPKMSGFEVCEKIRSKYSSTELPVIMVTAKNQVTDLVTGLTAGANDYITKPYSKNELLARIKTQLSLIKAAKAFGTLSAIEKELSVAKNMQLSALPASLPVSSSWEFSAVCIPVKDVGGDYYDYHQIDDKNLGIIIGDVSGHGIPAALTVSMLKIAFSLQLPNAHNPKMIMENINKILYGHCGHNFITAAYVFINIELKALYYSNAGHPPVYLWKAKTEKLIQLNAKGTAIGFNSSSEFQMKSHEIDNGDKIIMYTDGFTEARNKSDELYEDERLMEEISKNRDLSANNLKNHLVAEINKWSENQIDDLTLVVIDIL
jgi:two-component system sensor histidine kinase ChiS